MFGKINGMFLQGLEGMHVLVEADVSDGLPGYSFVGVLASEVKEAQDRVRTAIRNLHVSLPPKKVTINLSPADIRKEGTGFDLPIAVCGYFERVRTCNSGNFGRCSIYRRTGPGRKSQRSSWNFGAGGLGKKIRISKIIFTNG